MTHISENTTFDKVFDIYSRAVELGILEESTHNMFRVYSAVESAEYVFDLDFDVLLQADDFTFAHDVSGLVNNIKFDMKKDSNQSYTQKDYGFFLPRLAGVKSINDVPNVMEHLKPKGLELKQQAKSQPNPGKDQR